MVKKKKGQERNCEIYNIYIFIRGFEISFIRTHLTLLKRLYLENYKLFYLVSSAMFRTGHTLVLGNQSNSRTFPFIVLLCLHAARTINGIPWGLQTAHPSEFVNTEEEFPLQPRWNGRLLTHFSSHLVYGFIWAGLVNAPEILCGCSRWVRFPSCVVWRVREWNWELEEIWTVNWLVWVACPFCKTEEWISRMLRHLASSFAHFF